MGGEKVEMIVLSQAGTHTCQSRAVVGNTTHTHNYKAQKMGLGWPPVNAFGGVIHVFMSGKVAFNAFILMQFTMLEITLTLLSRSFHEKHSIQSCNLLTVLTDF